MASSKDVVEEEAVEKNTEVVAEIESVKEVEVETKPEEVEKIECEEVKKEAKPARKPATGEVDIKQLLEAGAHFGHKTSRWHPKMAQYIHSKREGVHIIDLTRTVAELENALEFLTQTVAGGKQVLLVGTKRQAKDIIKQLADDTGMPYVTERWLGGLLTNQKTISVRIKHLKDLEAKMES